MSKIYQNLIYPIAKRTVDIAAALVGISLLGPVMLVILIARKMERPTRVIFFQTRIGKNGKLFKLCKFSSMTTTTDEEEREYFRKLEKDNPKLMEEYRRSNFKFKDDPRITRVGKFIRRFSIDELPQFFNVLRGETETGVTIILMDEQMDHGPILAQEKIALDPAETTSTAMSKLAQFGGGILARTIPDYLNGKIAPQPQDHTQATYTKLVKKDDGKVNWQENNIQIERMARAYNPWPGVWTEIESRVKSQEL